MKKGDIAPLEPQSNSRLRFDEFTRAGTGACKCGTNGFSNAPLPERPITLSYQGLEN